MDDDFRIPVMPQEFQDMLYDYNNTGYVEGLPNFQGRWYTRLTDVNYDAEYDYSGQLADIEDQRYTPSELMSRFRQLEMGRSNSFTFNITDIGFELRRLHYLMGNGDFIFRASGKYITMNFANRQKLLMLCSDVLLADVLRFDQGDRNGSSQSFVEELLFTGQIQVFTIESRQIGGQREQRRQYHRHRGAWFEYAHVIPGLDLTGLQIFHVDDVQTDEQPCIAYALAKAGCPKNMAEYLKVCVAKHTNCLSLIRLKEICIKFKVQVVVNTIRKRQAKDGHVEYHKRLIYIPKKSGDYYRKCTICLFNKHYFNFQQNTGISKSALLNPELAMQRCGDGKWWNVLLKQKEKHMNSWHLVKTLLTIRSPEGGDLKYLSKLNRLEQTVRLKGYLSLDHQFTDLQFDSNQFIAPYGVRPKLEESVADAIERWQKRQQREQDSAGDVKETGREMLFAFDFETTTEGDQHMAYMVSVQKIMPCQFSTSLESLELESKENEVVTFEGHGCGKKMLQYVADVWLKTKTTEKEIGLIAHNAGYDLSFLINHFDSNYNPEWIRSGLGKLKKFRAKFTYGSPRKQPTISKKRGRYKAEESVFISVRDSLNFTMCALSNFPKMFALGKIEKEIMPYSVYTRNLCFNTSREDPFHGMVLLDSVLSILTEREGNNPRHCYAEKFKVQGCTTEDVQESVVNRILKFEENAKKWGCIWNHHGEVYVDMLRYSKVYCERDVEILAKGYCKLRHMFFNVTGGLNIDRFVSVNHLTNYALQKAGCTEGVLELSGIPRDFIQHCVTGGKCMLRNNEKQRVTGQAIADFDAVSLYPSAMAEMPGLLRGGPKIIPEGTTREELSALIEGGDKGAWFGKIRILSVGKKWQMPICNRLNEKGRHFSNDMVGDCMYCSNVVADDMEKMQDIKYEVLQGYYFDEGYNPKLKEFITNIFNERLKMKKDKNPMQLVYKLMMNGCYGRLILKPVETDIKFTNSSVNFKTTLKRDWEVVKEFDVMEPECPWSHCITFYKEIYQHWSAPHLGVMILDYSKRIMNRLHHIAHDLDIPIYYMDTDSMHFLNKDVHRMSEEYKVRHKDINDGELIGKKLGQFHNDFNLKAIGPVTLDAFDEKDIRSEAFTAFGKKCYLHKLTAPCKGASDLKMVKSHSFAMKGFTEASVYDVCNMNNLSIDDLFESVFSGGSFTADLLAGNRCSFEYNRNFKVKSRSEMTRTIRCII